MNSKLIIVTDLGHLAAYRETKNPEDHHPHLHLVREIFPSEAHEKMSEQVTDQPGRFPRGNGSSHINGDLSVGERMQIHEEQERRIISHLAGAITDLLSDEEVHTCHLAASASIHKQLLDAINPAVRPKVAKIIPSNLTKTDPKELPKHFAAHF